MAENAGQTADTIRWQGFTHKELYTLLHQGSGPAASAEPSRRWAEIAATLTEVGEDLQAAIGRSGSGWSGRAAGAAYERLAGLADWAHQTANGAGEMRLAVENQAEHLAQARAQMPVPDDAPPAQPDPAMQVLASQQDKEPLEAAATAGQQRAFEVMAAYQRNTHANTGSMAAFTPPAELTGMGEVHRHHDFGISLVTPALSIGVGLGLLPSPETTPSVGIGHGGHHGGHGGGGGWGGGPSIGVGEDVDFGRRQVLPGVYSGASRTRDSWFDEELPRGFGDRSTFERTSTGIGAPGAASGPGPGSGSATGTGTGAGTGPVSGAGSHRGGVPTSPGLGTTGAPGTVHSPDLQSAVASQMAAAAGTPAAATPGVAAGSGIGMTGAQDARGPMRRFGMDTIGSGQWFGDAPEADAAVGGAPSRRRFERDERLTEHVSIDGEEHNLPPTVIGED